MWKAIVSSSRLPIPIRSTCCVCSDDQGAQIALLIYEGGAGVPFLSESGAFYPEAGRLLLADALDDSAALDYSLLTSWTPPETHLYPMLDELLAEWRASVNRSFSRVSGIMTVRAVRVRLSDSLHRAAESLRSLASAI